MQAISQTSHALVPFAVSMVNTGAEIDAIDRDESLSQSLLLYGSPHLGSH